MSGAVIVTSSYVLYSYGTKLNIGLQPDPRASRFGTDYARLMPALPINSGGGGQWRSQDCMFCQAQVGLRMYCANLAWLDLPPYAL